jgi:iron(III) transport system permease protein
VVLGPFLALLHQLGQAAVRQGGDWLWLAVPTGRRGWLLLHSVALAGGVAAAGAALGVLAAAFLWRRRQGAWACLRWLPLILLPIPFCVHALAWMTLADGVNYLFRLAGLAAMPFQGGLAAWWVQLAALLPLAMGLALVGLESVDPALIEAGRLCSSDAATMGRIVLPLAAPKILAGAGFLFLLSITDYSVPSLLQYNVYAMEIFAEFSASHDPARALALAAPLLVVTVAVVIGSLAGLPEALQKPAWRLKVWDTPPAWPRWFMVLEYGAMGLLLGQMAVLLLGLVLSVNGWGNLAAAVSAAAPDIFYSLRVAGLTALFCLPLALAAARQMQPGQGTRWLWRLMITATLAIPAPLTGIGLITLGGGPWFPPFIVERGLMPVLADISRFTPWAAVALLVQLITINPLWLEAARVMPVNPLRTWLQVELPILAPGLLAGAALAFILSLGELGATLLVAPPGRATWCMRIYNYLHYGAADTVASLCLLLAAAVLLAGGAAALILAGWFRLLPRREDASGKINVKR